MRLRLFPRMLLLASTFTFAQMNLNLLLALQKPQPTFKQVTTWDSGGQNASSVISLDINNDGDADLVVANSSSGTAAVLLGNGDGTFQAAVSYISGGGSPLIVALTDVDGDGKLDLLVGNECGSSVQCKDGSVGILLGNGDGTFQSAKTFSSGSNSPLLSMVAVDINSDGRTDILMGNQCVSGACVSGSVSVLLGNGDGTFKSPSMFGSGGLSVSSIAVADINRDGKSDVLVSNGLSVGVLLGNGDGTFQTASDYGISNGTLSVADVNRDDKLDIVTSSDSATVAVLLGNGDGTFQAPSNYGTLGLSPDSIGIADINGDGSLDLVVANLARCAQKYNCNGLVSVLLGNGDGSFKAATSHNTGGYGASSLAVSDVNGDGMPDLVIANLFRCHLKDDCLHGEVGVLLGVPMKTTTTLTTSNSPSTVGLPVMFSAATTSAYGPIADGTTIKFYDGKTVIGTASTVNGTAKLTISSLTAKAHIIKAAFQANPFFKGSAATLKEIINH